MTPNQELEQLREWVKSKNINEMSFEIRVPAPRIRAFKNGDSKDPSYTTIRKIQEYKNKLKDDGNN